MCVRSEGGGRVSESCDSPTVCPTGARVEEEIGRAGSGDEGYEGRASGQGGEVPQ